MNSIKIFFKASADRSLILTAIKVAVIVGIILNLINQSEALIQFDLSNLNYLKFILTFFIPFGVSVYSSVRMRLNIKVGTRAKIDAVVNCVSCEQNTFEIKKDDLIKDCENCGENTKYKVVEVIH